MLEELRRQEHRSLQPPEGIIHAMVVRGLEREIALRRAFPFGRPDGSSPYAVSQRHGTYLQLGVRDDGAADRIDAETEQLRAEAARGIVTPDFILASILEAQRSIAAGELRPDLRAAMARQSAALEKLRPIASPQPGVWRLPDGDEYYRLRLRCTSGSDTVPGEVERLILAETRPLLARADRLLKTLGLNRSSIGERLRALKVRRKYLYGDDDPGRERAVADMNAALARLRPHLATWFNPPFDLRPAVRRMSRADERAGRRGFRDSADARRAGTYYPDLLAIGDRPRWTLTTVAYHETLPGHLLQAQRQSIAAPHPLQLRYAAGYSEGWAIYAETLVDRIGLLSPVDQLGFIQSFLFRLGRVRADIGIHLRRWDRARALNYLRETVGFDLFFPFAVEVDRYAAEPGSFAGDAMVALELQRIGRAAAGPTAVRRFHDRVLGHGPLTSEALAALTA